MSLSNVILPVVVSVITIFIIILIIVIVLVIVGITAVYVNRKVCYTINVLFKSQFFLESNTRSSDAELSSIWYKRRVVFLRRVLPINNTSGYEYVQLIISLLLHLFFADNFPIKIDLMIMLI